MHFFYKESKSNKKRKMILFFVFLFFFFFFLGGGGGGVDGRTDEHAKPICPFNFFKVGGITMHKCTSYGPDKLNI